MSNTKGTLMHKRWFCALLVAALLLMAAVPAMAETYGTVRNPNGGTYVNLRDFASYDAAILARVPVGTEVQITRVDGAWYAVRTDGTIGYIHSAFLAVGPAPASEKATVNAGTLNMRETPSLSAKVLTKLAYGKEVSVLYRGETWSQIRVDGLNGYVVTSYLKFGGGSTTPTPPGTTPNANATVKTNGNNLNLRKDASSASAVIASYANGTRVRVLTHGASWCRVQVGSQYGYMSTQYLKFDGRTGTSGGYAALVSNPGANQVLNLRAAPSVSAKSLGQYRNGTQIKVLAVGTEWHRVSVNGTVGYMQAKFVKLTDASATPHKTVSNGGTFVNLREGPSLGHDVLKKVPHDAAATVLTPYEVWSKVIVKDGSGYMTGYMMNSFLR